MFGFQLTVGVSLLIVAFTAQWLIKKRLQNKKALQKPLSWIAWTFAALGGTALSINLSDVAGVTAVGATLVSVAGLLVIVVDLVDKRPDWPAFFLIAIIPSFMKVSAGMFGQFFDFLLLVPTQFTVQAGAWFGF